jgi:hypothetical protein
MGTNDFWQFEYLNLMIALVLNFLKCGKFWKSIFIKNTLKAILLKINKYETAVMNLQNFSSVERGYSNSIESKQFICNESSSYYEM